MSIDDEEALTHPKRNLITQALGMEKLRHLKVGEVAIRPGDPGWLMLCSDGVSDMLNDAELAQLLFAHQAPDEAAAALKAAVENTDARDNFSFVLLKYQPTRLAGWANRIRIPWQRS